MRGHNRDQVTEGFPVRNSFHNFFNSPPSKISLFAKLLILVSAMLFISFLSQSSHGKTKPIFGRFTTSLGNKSPKLSISNLFGECGNLCESEIPKSQLHQLMVEERNSNFQSTCHAHLVSISQKYILHISLHFQNRNLAQKW